MGRNKEEQFQMSDELALAIVNYLKQNNITLAEFCEQNNLYYYMTCKIISRKLKMHIQLSYLVKLSKIIGVSKINMYINK